MVNQVITFLLMAVGSALAANVLIYNPVSSPVANRGVEYRRSVNTTEYTGATNAVINPVMPAAFSNGLSAHWFWVSNGSVHAMTVTQSNSIVSAEAASVAASRAFFESNAKTAAISGLASMSMEQRLIRALAVVTLNEINMLRTNPTATVQARTLTQLTNAIRNELQSQPNTSQ